MSPKGPHYAGGPGARYLLMGVSLALTVFGLVMIYSASSITASLREGTSWHFLLRQLMFVVMGTVVAFLIARMDYRALKERSFALWAVSVGMLGLTVLIGAVRGGARRWIPLGLFNLQPSELAKIACVLLVAMLAVEWRRRRIDDSSFLRRAAITTIVPSVMIVLQPDLGTTITLVFAVAVVLYLAGIDMKWVVSAFVAVVGLAAVAIMAEPYRIKRVLSFLDPWADPLGKGYQSVQALLAFGTGGVDGVGLGLSRQKFFYLPEAHTDFIFAIIGEEVGLIGTLAVVLGFVLLVWAGFRIAVGSKDQFGRLLAGGLTAMLGFQAILNMAAVTGIMPVTGKPLPFVSYGGSSMLVTMICLGLILSVSQYGAHAPRAVRLRPKSEDTHAGANERRRDSGARVSRIDSGRPSRRRA